VIGIVAPVGHDVRQSGADKTRDDQAERELAEGLDVESLLGESSTGVEETDVGRDGETEAVGVKDQRTEVKRSGDARHA
jgi:hypothetical protein